MQKPLWALLLSATIVHGSVYVNTFDSPAALNDFTVYGEQFVYYAPPPLHTVNVSGGQLVIQTSYLQPNYPDTAPTLFGRAALSLNTSSWGNGYNPTLAQNTAPISWSINLANQDGTYNNQFFMVLASTTPDPYDIGGHGYYFWGGGSVGNRMGLWRFDYGIGGGQTALVDVFDGLGTLPMMGSIRITYNPANNQWQLFGVTDTAYHDATQISTLLGTATDGTYTGVATPHFALGGAITGTDYFDNLVVAVPEPAAGLFWIAFGPLLYRMCRKLKAQERGLPGPACHSPPGTGSIITLIDPTASTSQRFNRVRHW